MEDYYHVLGVPPDVSQEEIKERFRFLAHAYHPDKFATPGHKKYAEETFKKINDAYQVLSHPARRTQYDRQRSSSGSKYEDERHRREEAETAQRRAREEQRKREEHEVAQRRAAEEQRRREQAEAARRHAAEEQPSRRKLKLHNAVRTRNGTNGVVFSLFGSLTVLFGVVALFFASMHYADGDYSPAAIAAGIGVGCLLTGIQRVRHGRKLGQTVKRPRSDLH